MRKKEKKDKYLSNMKSGPFLAGSTHSGFGNTVGIGWKSKKLQQNLANKMYTVSGRSLRPRAQPRMKNCTKL